MTTMDNVSQMARRVEEYVKYNFASLAEVKVSGTPRGRSGIVLNFPKNGRIKVEAPRLNKGRIATKAYGRKPVLIKMAVPSDDGAGEAYIELEYINS